jgi:hypothetical protein
MRRSSDLPILDELGAEFRRLVAAELGASGVAATPASAAVDARPAPVHAHPTAVRRRRGGRRRLVRRAAIVFALLCLVGTGALAARVHLGGGQASDTSPAVLGSGAGWQLAAHRHAGSLCLLVDVSGDLADSCGPLPGPRGVRATSAVGLRVRYVVGLAGRDVARVRVRVGTHVVTAVTHAPADRGRATGAGVPSGMRWFVAVLPLGAGVGTAPARVAPLDAAGRSIGAAALDCSLGVVGAACEQMAAEPAHGTVEGSGG